MASLEGACKLEGNDALLRDGCWNMGYLMSSICVNTHRLCDGILVRISGGTSKCDRPWGIAKLIKSVYNRYIVDKVMVLLRPTL